MLCKYQLFNPLGLKGCICHFGKYTLSFPWEGGVLSIINTLDNVRIFSVSCSCHFIGAYVMEYI